MPLMDAPGAVTKILSVCEVERVKMRKHDDLSQYWSGGPELNASG